MTLVITQTIYESVVIPENINLVVDQSLTVSEITQQDTIVDVDTTVVQSDITAQTTTAIIEQQVITVELSYNTGTGGGGGGTITQGANIGTSGVGVYEGVLGDTLQFRNVVSTNTGTLTVGYNSTDKTIELTATGGGGGNVDSVFGRTGIVVAEENDYTWDQIDKTASSLADITNVSHTLLTDIGTNTHPQIDGHIASTANPHSVTAAQVGAVDLTTAQSIAGLKTFTTLPQSSGVPSVDNDLTNKQYVDNFVNGLKLRTAVDVATATALSTSTYNNGSSGVGATLTRTGNGALGNIDGYTPSVGQRIGVKDEVAQLRNGIYTITSLGSGSTPWVLTRATDYDEANADEVSYGSFFSVINGATNTAKQFALVGTAAITIGTTALVFTQVNAPPNLVLSNGLNNTGFNGKLGGPLTENTTITLGTFNLTHNLDSTGDFIIQDAGVSAFTVDDTGFTRVGSAITNLAQLAIQPISAATKGQVIRAQTSQTANLWETQLVAGTAQNYVTSDHRFFLQHTSVNRTSTLFDISQTPIINTISATTTNNYAMTTRFVAFPYTPSSDIAVQTVAWFLRNTGTFTNGTTTMVMRLRADSAGAPGAALAGTTAQTQRIGGLTASYAEVRGLIASTSVTLVGGTQYWITLELGAIPTGANLEIRGGATGTYYTSPDGTTWTSASGVNAQARLYSPVGRLLDLANDYGASGMFIQNNVAPTVLDVRGNNGTAIQAISTYGSAISATSTFGNAISGTTTSGIGISAVGNTGTGLSATSTSGTGAAVTTTSGTGLSATSTTGTGASITTTTGTAAIFTTTDGTGAIFNSNPSSTSTTHEMLRLSRTTSGTAADGIGAQVTVNLEGTTGSALNSHIIGYSLSTATTASSTAQVEWRLRNNNVMVNPGSGQMRLGGAGALVVSASVSAPRLISTVATGTAPVTVTSTTLNPNLNADLLDSQDGTYYLNRANHTGNDTITRVAGVAISALRVISVNPATGEARYADNTLTTTGENILGISTNAASIGQNVVVLVDGIMTDASWSWNTAGNPAVFVGTNGLITQTPPTSGYVRKIGFVVSATQIYVNIEQPVYLN